MLLYCCSYFLNAFHTLSEKNYKAVPMMPYTNMVHCFLVQASSFLFCVYVSAISKGAHSNNNDQTGTAAPEAPEQSVITSSPVLSHNEQPAVLQQDPATKQRTQNREQREKEINRS